MLVIEILCLIWLYFFPSLLAYYEEHPSKRNILLVNVFAGWTIAGWFVSALWALTPGRRWTLLSGRR